MASVGIFGAGWVGLVTGTCLAELGHQVVVRDIVSTKVEALRHGEVPFHEAELAELLARNAERLTFTDRAEELAGCDVLFVCVDTPPTASGDADLSRVWRVVDELPEPDGHAVLIMKSTVPVGTGEKVRHGLDERGLGDVGYVSNPEFLAEGTAVRDFMHPDRIVIGGDEQADVDTVAELYAGIEAQIVRCDVKSAEMIKLAANAFLMTRISFINEIANVCDATGADVVKVAEGIGLDHRLGPHFLKAGIGYGGSCLVGSETVVVRREGRSELTTLQALFDELEGEPASALDALAWSAETGAVFMPVSFVTRRTVEGELVEVRTEQGRRVSCTPDHPFVTARGVKLADELDGDDLLPLVDGALVREHGTRRLEPAVVAASQSFASTASLLSPLRDEPARGGTTWVRVLATRRRPFAGFVYSLEVPGPHTFVTTGGLVVHNCFPKDSLALKQLASNSGYHFMLLAAVIEVNELQKRRVIGTLRAQLGSLRDKKIAMLGLAFKPGTSDMREAPSIVLASRLAAEGAEVRAWDPVADGSALEGVHQVASIAEAVAGADAAVIVTEWPELAALASAATREAMANPLIIDGRNLLDPAAVRAAGFRYEGIGRPAPAAEAVGSV